MIDYTKLDVWQRARQLASVIYSVTAGFPREELFAMTSQMRRAVVSVSSNIAEACGRGTAADTCRLLYFARGSLFEVESQSYVALDLHFLTTDQLDLVLAETEHCRRLLNGFIAYYERRRDGKSGPKLNAPDESG